MTEIYDLFFGPRNFKRLSENFYNHVIIHSERTPFEKAYTYLFRCSVPQWLSNK